MIIKYYKRVFADVAHALKTNLLRRVCTFKLCKRFQLVKIRLRSVNGLK